MIEVAEFLGGVRNESERTLQSVRFGLELVWKSAPRLLVFSFVLQAIVGFATVAAVALGGRLAQRLVALAGGSEVGVGGLIVGFLLVTLVGSVAAVVKDEYQDLLAEEVQMHATDAVLAVAVRSDLLDFERPAFHDRLERAKENAGWRPVRLVQGLLGLVSTSIAVIGLGIILVRLALPLIVVLAVGTLPMLWAAHRMTSRTYRFELAQSERDRRRMYMNAALTDRSPAVEIQLYGIGDHLRTMVAEDHRKRIFDLRELLWVRTWLGVFTSVVALTVGGVVLFSIARLARDQSIDVEEASVAAVALLLLAERLGVLVSSLGSVRESSLFLAEIEELVAETPAVANHPDPLLDEPVRSIELRGVSFRYPSSDVDVLRSIDLELPGHGLVAVVGQNGSGKSTLARLLGFLYQPTDGSLLFNGHVSDFSLAPRRRRRMAMVHQDHLDLLLTASENIELGDVDRPRDEAWIRQVGRRAGIHDKLSSLPHGYETLLGTEFSGGQELSVGQWQRLSTARAYYRNADVLILDEPTSALDPEAEVEMIKRLKGLAHRQLVVLISHRFGTVSQADRIVVLDHGIVAEDGTHSELMAHAGIYASMFTTQAESFR